jgi:hypothetical protein
MMDTTLMSLRVTVYDGLFEALTQGHSLDTVQLLLGHSHPDYVTQYLEVTPWQRWEAIVAFDRVRDKD